MDFPHLGDTQFPNLNNANVYAFKNTFDYTRWVPNTKIRLVNVLWNSDYGDVVKFETNEERDEWFDSIDDYYDLMLTGNTRILPDNTVKIPVPFDVAIRYNYMYIDFSYATSLDNPIEYEQEYGIRRWYFFVNDIQYSAPNTTVLTVSIDTWTNYINDVDIKYMILERGHAPMAYSDVDVYLSNPISHNKYLLASDITFGDADICKKSNFIPVGNGTKFMCFASTCTPYMLSTLGNIVEDSDYTYGNITYSDVDVRYGYQLQVNGFGIGNGLSYEGVKTPVSPFAIDNDMVPNGFFVYAINMQYIADGSFFNAIKNNNPSFLYTIQGCFMVSDDMIMFGESYNIAGFDVFEVLGADEYIGEFKLNKDDFNYPDKYKEFAKLYTYPYSYIELTDNNGKTVEVRIEETSTIRCRSVCSLAFPYINNRVYFDGINGVGSNVYSWKSLTAVDISKEMPNSDWFKYCFDMEIPCYALYIDGETAFMLTNFNRSIKNARRSALVNYHNSARQANTARQNSIDASNTSNTNTYADANTMVSNTANSTATATANTEATVATNNANMLVKDRTDNQLVTTQIRANSDTIANANAAGSVSVDIQQERTSSLAVTNSIAAIGGSLAAAPMTGGLSLLAGIGALGGNALSAGVVNTATQKAYDNQVTLNKQNLGVNNSTSNSQVVFRLIGEYEQVANNNNCMETHTRNNNARDTQNTANTTTTMKNNSDRTTATANANSNYTREVAILNAKEILENTRNGAMAALEDARNARPVQLTNNSGNPAADYYGTRGVQMKIKTLNESELTQTGDFFARYGYALNQNWDIQNSGFNLMKHFTFWKATEVWVDDRKSSNNLVQLSIVEILKKGVTVWSNPEEIGKVDIYDN